MIPVELKLTNFMSYKYMDEPLDFSSIHTAVLCGPNGHGKSTLLDAITWALWGQARGVDKRGTGTDDLIHHKEPHMQAEFTFELEGQLYRVIRSRQRKGKIGLTRLEFQIIDSGVPRSLTGESINATQEVINRTLRMDYETFINSALIMQGHADNFMKKTANERKEILSQILGLSIYDELEELAKEKRKEVNEHLRLIDDRLIHIDQELEQLPIYERELEKAQEALAKIQDEIKGAEEALANLREKKAIFDVKAMQITELNARCNQTKIEIEEMEVQLKRLKENEVQANKLLAEKEAIDLAYLELSELRKKEEQLSRDEQTFRMLEAKANNLKHIIAQAKNNLESGINHLLQRKTELEKEINQRSAIELALNQNKAKLIEFEQAEQELNEMRERYSELQKKIAELDVSKKALEEKVFDLERRRSLLSDDDTCPLCKKPLADHEKTKISEEFSNEISLAKRQIGSCKTELANLARELDKLRASGKELSEKIKEKSVFQAKEGSLIEKLRAIDKMSEELAMINRQVNELNLKLAQDAFAVDEHFELERLSSKLRDLNYQADEHQKIREKLKKLLKYEQLKANLDNAETNIEMIKSTSEALFNQKEAKLKLLDEDKKKIEALTKEIKALKSATEEIRHIEELLAQKRKSEATIIDQRSTAQVKINNCKELTKQKDKLNKNRKRAAKEVEIYDKLAFIFSKRGIQALIIENTIPEIEEEANLLLHKLTGGQMSLRFVTQKDQKTGGVVETLDLIITDGELGERKYELFSGGEAFRINFAVRIALSKLLARRAGARLETLIIDEGFGTQDEEGKERLIEAISAVQNDFKKIIVITHLDDLKELFPSRIEVIKKRGLGSIATVS